VYGKGSTGSEFRSSFNKGSCREDIGRLSRTSSTKGSGVASTALTHTAQPVASSTARTPSVLFLGDRNRAF
jgi:hypothetical protein